VPVEAQRTVVRPLTELDIEGITRIDELVSGRYRPEFWEARVGYYLRRDPEACRVAEAGGTVVGFMLADVRGGEFGLEETSAWIERFGVDPRARGQGIGRKLFDSLAEHFRAAGVTCLRTLSDREQAEADGFLRSVGFQPSPLAALEMRLEGDAGGSGR
jgi:ribosomal protein S18 acetylase RimI-like enzyme